MYLDPPLRRSVLIMLSMNLILTLIRQLIDFLGRLWFPIVVNFLNLIMLIFAIFGTVQLRTSFLSSFGTWTLCWLGWNAFIVCFYLNIGNLDRNKAYMSFGMKGSHSFWIDHTPLCETLYNHSVGHWVVSEQCYVQYYYIEIIQAAVHLLITSICIVLVIAYLQVLRVKSVSSSASRRSSSLKQPRVTVEFPADDHTSFSHQRNARVAANPDAYDGTSSATGYMNTSYETNTPTPVHNIESEYVPSLDPNGQLVQNYRKSSKRKSKSKKRAKSVDHLQQQQYSDEDNYNQSLGGPHQYELHSDFSRAPTSMVEEAARRQEDRRRERQRSSSVDARNRHRDRRRNRHRSVSPPQSGRPTSSTTMESRLTPEVISMHDNAMMHAAACSMQQPISEYPRRGDKRSSSLKYKPFKHYATPGLQNLGAATNGTFGRSTSQDQNLNHAHNEDLRDYNREPRRLSKAEPKCLMNSMDSMTNSRHQQRAPMTSLVSFDPKSQNTLIRYHEHMARSQEHLLANRSRSHETLSASVPSDESSTSIPSSSSNGRQQSMQQPMQHAPAQQQHQFVQQRDQTNEPTYVQATRGRPPPPPCRASPSVIQQRAQQQQQQQHQQATMLNYYSVPPNHMQVEIASNDSGLPPSLNQGPTGSGSAPSSQGGSEWSGSDDRTSFNNNNNSSGQKQQNGSLHNHYNQNNAYGASYSQSQDTSYQPRYSKGPHVTRPSHFASVNAPPMNSLAGLNSQKQFEPSGLTSRTPIPYGSSSSTVDLGAAPTNFNDTSADSLPPPPPLPSNYDQQGYSALPTSSTAQNSKPQPYGRSAGPALPSLRNQLAQQQKSSRLQHPVVSTANSNGLQKSYREEIVNNFLRDALCQQQEQTKSIANLNPLKSCTTPTPLINDRSLLV